MPKDALRTAKMPRKGSRQADATEGCIVCAGFHGKQRDLKNNASVLNNDGFATSRLCGFIWCTDCDELSA